MRIIQLLCLMKIKINGKMVKVRYVIRRVARISQRGGGLFLKFDTTVNKLDPNFHLFQMRLRRFFCQLQVISKKKGLRRISKGFSGRNQKFKGFFCPKTGDSKKKKKFKSPWGGGLFSFLKQKSVRLQKRPSPKFRGFFWPKSQIQGVFPAKNR